MHSACRGQLRPSPRLRAFRRRLLKHAKEATPETASVAASLLVYTEALASVGTERDDRTMEEGLNTLEDLMERLGSPRWDRLRVGGPELAAALERPSPWQLSALSRLVSLASGSKHVATAEMQEMSAAVPAALMRDDVPECAICLQGWQRQDKVVVPMCGHALHADCFWQLALLSQGDARGRCPSCLQPFRWGPLARSNLRCTMATAAGALQRSTPYRDDDSSCKSAEVFFPIKETLRGQRRFEDALGLIDIAMRIAEALGQPVVGTEAAWEELLLERERRGRPLECLVAKVASAIVQWASSPLRLLPYED